LPSIRPTQRPDRSRSRAAPARACRRDASSPRHDSTCPGKRELCRCRDLTATLESQCRAALTAGSAPFLGGPVYRRLTGRSQESRGGPPTDWDHVPPAAFVARVPPTGPRSTRAPRGSGGGGAACRPLGPCRR
jgi:hypothetical protein